MINVDKFSQLSLILFSGAVFAVADALIKRVALTSNNLLSAMKSPWMIVIGAIYIFAIAVFAYSFLKKWDLGIVGLLQIVIYAAVVILLGIVFFHEKITLMHGVGMGLAVLAAILMNI